MNFINPWALAIGAAAVALPVVIHLLTRPRPIRLPLSPAAGWCRMETAPLHYLPHFIGFKESLVIGHSSFANDEWTND